MICQRCGHCCVTMFVVVPHVGENGTVRALAKPGGVRCPNLSWGPQGASCAVHDLPEYEGSPCWVYGNPDVDPDFEHKRGRPCPVGEYMRRGGRGLPETSEHAGPVEDIGRWGEFLP